MRWVKREHQRITVGCRSPAATIARQHLGAPAAFWALVLLIGALSVGTPGCRAMASEVWQPDGVGLLSSAPSIDFGLVAPGTVVTRERAVKLKLTSYGLGWWLYTSASSDLAPAAGSPTIPLRQLQWATFSESGPPQWTPYRVTSALVSSGYASRAVSLDLRLDLTYPGSFALPSGSYSTTLTHTVLLGGVDQSFVVPDPFVADGVATARFYFYASTGGTHLVEFTVVDAVGVIAFFSSSSMVTAGWTFVEWNGRRNDGRLVDPGLYRYVIKVDQRVFAEGVFAVAAQANHGGAALEGTVVSGGIPVAGVTVSARSLATRAEIGRTVTTADGRYRIDGLPGGYAYAEAYCPGYFPSTSAAVLLEEGQTTRLDFSILPNKTAFVSISARATAISPGDLVELVVRIRNSGTRDMKKCRAWVELPPGLYPASKALLDRSQAIGAPGGPDSPGSGAPPSIRVDLYCGDLSPGNSVTLELPACAGMALERCEGREVSVRAALTANVGSAVDAAEDTCSLAVTHGPLTRNTGELGGMVLAATGGSSEPVPVADALVLLSNGAVARTGTDGRFELRGVTCGPHLLTAEGRVGGRELSGRILATVVPGANFVRVTVQPTPEASRIDFGGEVSYETLDGWRGRGCVTARITGSGSPAVFVGLAAGGGAESASEIASRAMSEDRVGAGVMAGRLDVVRLAPLAPEVDASDWMVRDAGPDWGGWLPSADDWRQAREARPDAVVTELAQDLVETADGFTVWLGGVGARAWLAAGRSVYGVVADVFDAAACGPYTLTRLAYQGGGSSRPGVPLWVAVVHAPDTAAPDRLGRAYPPQANQTAWVEVEPSSVRYEPSTNSIWLDRPPRDFLGLELGSSCYVVVGYASPDPGVRPVVVAEGVSLSGRTPFPWRAAAWGFNQVGEDATGATRSNVVAQVEPVEGVLLHYSLTHSTPPVVALNQPVAVLAGGDRMTLERLAGGLRLPPIGTLRLGVDRVSWTPQPTPQDSAEPGAVGPYGFAEQPDRIVSTRAFLSASGGFAGRVASGDAVPSATTWQLTLSEPLDRRPTQPPNAKAVLEHRWQRSSLTVEADVTAGPEGAAGRVSGVTLSTDLKGSSLVLRTGLAPGSQRLSLSATAAWPLGLALSAAVAPGESPGGGGACSAGDWEVAAGFTPRDGVVSSVSASLSHNEGATSTAPSGAFRIDLRPSPWVRARIDMRSAATSGGSLIQTRLTAGNPSSEGVYTDVRVARKASSGASWVEAAASLGVRLRGACLALDAGAVGVVEPDPTDTRGDSDPLSGESLGPSSGGGVSDVSSVTGRIAVRSGVRLADRVTLWMDHSFSIQRVGDGKDVATDTESGSSASLYVDWAVHPGVVLRVGYALGFTSLPWLTGESGTGSHAGPFVRLVAGAGLTAPVPG